MSPGTFELADREGRAWRCELPGGAVALARVTAEPAAWGALQDGVDADDRPEVLAGWWMVEAEAGRAAVLDVDRRRRRLARIGVAAMLACFGVALFAWGVNVSWIPPAARGGLGFLILVLGGLPALGVYLGGTGTLQFGVGLRERRLGQARAERAEGELASLKPRVPRMVVVLDTLGPRETAPLAAVVRRALALPGVERALVVTPREGRRDALAAALGRTVEPAALARVADA